LSHQRHSSFRLSDDIAGRKRTDMPSNASELCTRSMSDGRRGTECGSGADFFTETPAGTTSDRPGSSYNVLLYAPLESARISDQPAYAAVLPRSAGPDVAEYAATKNASGSMAEVTSQSLPKILPLYNLQHSLDAVGLHRYAETSSAAYCLDRDLQHFAPSLRRPVGLGSVRGDNHQPEGSRDLGKGAQRVSRPATSNGRLILDVCVSPICSCSGITVPALLLLRVAVNRPHANAGGSPDRTGARWSRGKRWSVVHRSL
jgi:hypothetical protein